MAIVGYWRLNGNANDYSGNGYNGTLLNSPTSSVGIKDGAYTFVEETNPSGGFNGSGIQLPADASLKGKANATISLWCYLTSNPTIENGALYYESSDVDGYGKLAIYHVKETTNFLFQMRDTSIGSSFFITLTSCVTLNKWMHTVMTFNDSTNELFAFINGVKVGENTEAKGVIYAGVPVFVSIGSQKSHESIYSCNGKIDEVCIDNSTWSPAKIKNEYSRVKGFF